MFEQTAKKIFASADINLDGKRPWDIKVNDSRFYSALFWKGMTGMGDAYVKGYWDCEQLDVMFTKALKNNLNLKARFNFINYFYFLKASLFNLQTPARAFMVGEEHYDIGNDLYEAMLDKRMVYTCGYWKNAKNLDKAQEAKLHLVCKKIGLKKGQRVLDIGCGWGSFAQFAAENYGASVVGVTVSKEQAELARKRCKGLPVEIRLQDYREVNEQFDHIISLGMFEHVGYRNYRDYMKVAHRCLKEGGLFLLHTMGERDSYPNTRQPECHWIIKNIFPNGMLPSVAQIGRSAEGLFVMEDWHTFGADYDKTMMAWFNNFDKAWPKLKQNYSEGFYRKWKYYLMLFVGAWRSRNQYNLWQIVFSKDGVPGGYQSLR